MKKGGKLEGDALSLSKGWKVERLGDVCEIDKIPNRKKNLPYVGLEHIESNTGKFIGSTEPQSVKSMTFNFSDKHVLYGRLRPYLKKVLLPDFEGHCSSEIFPLKVSNQLERGFLFHWLLSDETTEKINATSTGARMPRANMNAVLDFEIPIPPLPEQQRIVSVLDEAFASIAQAKSNAEQNLVNARELFESVLANMYESAGTHWEEKNLGDIASQMQTGPFGSTLHKSDYVANGIPVINPQNIVDGKIVPLQKMMVNQKTKERLSRYILQEKDIVLARRGEMGRCAIVEKEQAGWLCGSGSFVVRIKKEVNANYLVRYLSSAKVKLILQKGSVGTTMDNLNQGILSQVPVPFPPLAEQRAIVERLEALSAETGRLEEIYQQKVDALEELKKSVLGKAFEGLL